MAQLPKTHRRVEGTNRPAVTSTTRVRAADPAEIISVTVRLRRRAGAPPLPDLHEQLKRALDKREYLSREQFAARFGADPADVALAQEFARRYGLTVEETSIPRRSVRLSGSVKEMTTAFVVDFGMYEGKDISYRGREGHVHLPAELVDAVEGVFGLDNRRQTMSLRSRKNGLENRTN
jgi:kumamolisin